MNKDVQAAPVDRSKIPVPQPLPKHPFVEMIVVNSDGEPINTFCGENAPLAQILSTAAKMPDADNLHSPVQSVRALQPMGQNIYVVLRHYAQAYLRTWADKSPKDIEDQLKNMPETARYFFVVSY